MAKNDNLKKLKHLYSEIKKIKITRSPKNQELENLIDKIYELDAYYAGLALTVLEGGKISTKFLYNIDELYKSFEYFSKNYLEDKILLEECKTFINIISQIDKILRNTS